MVDPVLPHMDGIRSQFQLRSDIKFLNHGSFGACPIPVFEVYQAWQRELELQPVEFLGRRITTLMAEARQALGDYLQVPAENVVYFTNPTTAFNMAARSLDLTPGDTILATDHEYGAMDRTWHFITKHTGSKYVNFHIIMPVYDPDEWVEQFWSGVSKHTKIIFMSHLTSPTALIFPVGEICRRAKEHGILTIIDGAHAPGQLCLNLADLQADIYIGALHKWLCAPKGSAFLYASPEIQSRLAPLVVSWGYESEYPSNSQYVDYHEWQGTRDMSAFLSVPAAIRFQNEHNWSEYREICHTRAINTRNELNRLMGLPALSKENAAGDYQWVGQMVSIRLPECDVKQLKQILYDQYAIEIPVFRWQGHPIVRLSVQAYNTEAELQALIFALNEYFFESKQ
jgi:isopenicillin-N epimerase